MRLRTFILVLLLVTAALATWAAVAVEPSREVAPLPPEPSPQSVATVESDSEVVVSDHADVERTTPQVPPHGQAQKTKEVRFTLMGVAPERCHGVASLFRKDGIVETVPITGVDLALPVATDLRRVELAVSGYCVVEYRGPFESASTALAVSMLPAGEILVDVRDSSGYVLPGRTVYCFPQNERRRSPGELVKYRLTPWAVTDARGQAFITNVLPGEYKINTVGVAEWKDTTVTGVHVLEGTRASCVLTVPVLDPSTFGGFTLAADQVPFPSDVSKLRVEHYQFWTESGKPWPMYRIADSIRCIVLGGSGEVVRGRVQRRNSTGEVVASSRESEPIAVTVGAVRLVAPNWSDAIAK